MTELSFDVTTPVEFDVEISAPTVDITPVDGNVVVFVPVPGTPGPQGPQGPGGAPFEGTAWFYGTGVPDVVIGSKVGDFYMDTDTGTVYELQVGG